MINYLLELTLLHLLLTAIYFLFLRKENQYHHLRRYLLAVYVLALIIPALRAPELWSIENPEIIKQSVQIPSTFWEPPTDLNEESSKVNWQMAGLWIYSLISAWFLFQVVQSIVHLSKLVHVGKKATVDNVNVIYSDQIVGSFTFFNWIFVSKALFEDRDALLPIIKHEASHQKLGHSYDILFLQLFRAVFWWIPSSWVLVGEMKKIHEYQADADAIKSFDVSLYVKTLISQTLNINGINLASSFHDGYTLKRIKAMKKNISRINSWKLSTVGFMLTVLIIGFACNEELDAEIKKMGAQSNAITFDQLPDYMQTNLSSIQKDLSFVKVEMTEEDLRSMKANGIQSIEALAEIDPSTIYQMDVVKNEGAREVILALKKDGASFDHLANTSKSEEEVFTIVENQPEFPGGMTAFYEYVGSEIQYPEQARKLGIEGRVYVQFVVDTDGSITEAKTVKGIGGGCDGEAVRVLSQSPDWKPGTQRGKAVKVRMVMPVVFKLDKNTSTEEGNGVIVIEEIEMDKSQMKVSASRKNGVWFGTVYSAESNDPMPGVNVIETATNNGTVSDRDGNFKLVAKDDSHDLILTYVGFNSYKLSASK